MGRQYNSFLEWILVREKKGKTVCNKVVPVGRERVTAPKLESHAKPGERGM